MAGEKGVFCLEGNWDTDLRDISSVEPALELLRRKWKIPYIHRDAATREELAFYLKKWVQNTYAKYPILYLAFHGDKGCIFVDDRGQKGIVDMEWIAEQLEGKCQNRVIYFGSCATMDVRLNRLNRFRETTGALAICGYKAVLDWLPSSVFDIMVFDLMLDYCFDGRGIRHVEKEIKKRANSFIKEMKFRIVT